MAVTLKSVASQGWRAQAHMDVFTATLEGECHPASRGSTLRNTQDGALTLRCQKKLEQGFLTVQAVARGDPDGRAWIIKDCGADLLAAVSW